MAAFVIGNNNVLNVGNSEKAVGVAIGVKETVIALTVFLPPIAIWFL